MFHRRGCRGGPTTTMTMMTALVGMLVVLAGGREVQARNNGFPPPDDNRGGRLQLQTTRAYNIAHRGANGELPEETAEAYVRAIEVGADFIETDIGATKDGELICLHDVILDVTTDVLNHTEFADRVRTYEVEGEYVKGIFAVDLTLAEIKTLRALQRWPSRDHSFDGQFQLITFEEYINIALEAPRVVGIYPEIKDPVFVNRHVKWPGGKKFEDVVLDMLCKYGYKGKYMSKDWLEKPCFIQSFAPTSLTYVYNLTDLPLIFLIDDVTIRTQDTNQTYEEITSDAYLDWISQYVVGIGPWKDTVVPPNPKNYLSLPTKLVEKAHARNLQVHPYTFRNENQFLHFDFVEDPYQEYAYWIHDVGVDGLFTDFCQSLRLYQSWTFPLPADR